MQKIHFYTQTLDFSSICFMLINHNVTSSCSKIEPKNQNMKMSLHIKLILKLLKINLKNCELQKKSYRISIMRHFYCKMWMISNYLIVKNLTQQNLFAITTKIDNKVLHQASWNLIGTTLLTVWERRKTKTSNKKSPKEVLKLVLTFRIGHDIAILISLVRCFIFLLFFAVCSFSHDMTISTWFLTSRSLMSHHEIKAAALHEKNVLN